jgi:hypothetical protein
VTWEYRFTGELLLLSTSARPYFPADMRVSDMISGVQRVFIVVADTGGAPDIQKPLGTNTFQVTA